MDDFAARIDDDRLRALYTYWHGKRAGRFAPARADIDPLDIPRLLPLLLLTVVERDATEGLRLRYRLVGTEVEKHFGCTMGGRYIDELMEGHYRDYIIGLYHRLIASRRPHFSESAYRSIDSVLRTKRLMLPLSSDGREVDMVLSGQTFHFDNRLDAGTVLGAQGAFTDTDDLGR